MVSALSVGCRAHRPKSFTTSRKGSVTSSAPGDSCLVSQTWAGRTCVIKSSSTIKSMGMWSRSYSGYWRLLEGMLRHG